MAWYPSETDMNENIVQGVDIGAMNDGIAGNGVVSGMAVTPNGTPNTLVTVAAGTYIANGGYKSYAGASVDCLTNKTGAGVTNPRWDIIQADSSGNVTAKNGTAATPAVCPAPDSGKIMIAKIYRPMNDDVINNTVNGIIYNSRIIRESTCAMQFGSTTGSSGTVTFATAFPAGGSYYVFTQPQSGVVEVTSTVNTGFVYAAYAHTALVTGDAVAAFGVVVNKSGDPTAWYKTDTGNVNKVTVQSGSVTFNWVAIYKP